MKEWVIGPPCGFAYCTDDCDVIPASGSLGRKPLFTANSRYNLLLRELLSMLAFLRDP